MFFGTPRQHKGIGALAEAVGQISHSDFRLVVVGRASDPSVTAMLDAKAPGRVIQLPNQPFSAIPEVLACADIVALPQDVNHPVSLYQLPAKAIDAIAMGVPLLVSQTPPLMDLVRHGVATLVGEKISPERSRTQYATGRRTEKRKHAERHSSSAIAMRPPPPRCGALSRTP